MNRDEFQSCSRDGESKIIEESSEEIEVENAAESQNNRTIASLRKNVVALKKIVI